MILGGREGDGNESKIVEELDFIKRNLVSLPPLKQARAQPNAFLVNDAIYVFGGAQLPNVTDKQLSERQDIIIGEKFSVRESRWREVVSRSQQSHAAARAMQTLAIHASVASFGPASLLYE